MEIESEPPESIHYPTASIIIGDSRSMPELEDSSVSLVVTSPPYWHIKDYGTERQIGFGQSLHDYLRAIYQVWQECFRVLEPGRRLCINVGDQFARATVYGRYKVIPIHAEIISQCEQIGFDFMGSIIWQKKTTVNTSGGAPIMGSYPHPPNGIVELDYEHILLFKKPGPPSKIPKETKEASVLTKEEWKLFFSGHWHFKGTRQVGHEAMFPEELPRRLIRMFSFVGENVLDPFLGSGTTAKVALDLGRNAVGYEINREFVQVIREKIGGRIDARMRIENRTATTVDLHSFTSFDYEPRLQNADPPRDPEDGKRKQDETFKVVDILDDHTLKLKDGRTIGFLGVDFGEGGEVGATLDYLRGRVRGKQVILKFDEGHPEDMAYVYLKNRIFINAHLIRSGLGKLDRTVDHRLRKKFDGFHASAGGTT
jgi:modification methylase